METIKVSLDDLKRSGIGLDDYLEAVAYQLIEDALIECNHNKQQAAEILGLNRTTMLWRMGRSKILRLHINAPSRRGPVN